MKGHITERVLNHTYYVLTERAKIDLDFLILTVSAAIICALGFKMNSAAVIVGAMVVSPLLYPIICAGAATCRADWNEFVQSIGAFAAGFTAAVAAAAVIGLFYATAFRSEIIDRLSESVLDYFLVALFSGVAGTYAFFSPKIHGAVAGIAISVALIPPVVMLGPWQRGRNLSRRNRDGRLSTSDFRGPNRALGTQTIGVQTCRSLSHGWLAFGYPGDGEADLCQTGNSEVARGYLRDVDNSSGDEWTTVCNPDHGRSAVFGILNVDQRSEW